MIKGKVGFSLEERLGVPFLAGERAPFRFVLLMVFFVFCMTSCISGKYPKGGCCHTCGSIYHLQLECPKFIEQREKLQQQRENRKGKEVKDRKHKRYKPHKGGDEDSDAYWLQQLKS